VAPVTVPELRGLAKLYRSGIEGAEESIARIIADSGDELPDVLGFPRPNLERLLDNPNAVELLVATIEGAPRVARDARNRLHREGARELAAIVAANAEPRDDGTVALPLMLVTQMLSLWPGTGLLVLGERGSVDLGRLRAVLRECRGLTSTSLVVTSDAVVVAYTTARSRGLLRLFLQPILRHVDALVVPIAPAPVEVVAALAPSVVIAPTTVIEDAAAASSTVPVEPEPVFRPIPRPPIAPTRPWAMRILDGLAAALAGVP